MTNASRPPNTSFAYRLAGLDILSEIPLPDVPLCGGRPPLPDRVAVRRAHVPESLPSGEVFEGGQYDGRDLLLRIPEVSRYLIRDGREILVDPMPQVSDYDVSIYLLGTIFGALCHHRRILPLHACAIDTSKGCVAFVGASGEGKSTLAAALAKHGHNVISDDVCYLRSDEDMKILAWPGLGRIRLWQDSLDALDYGGQNIQQESRGYDKFLVPIRSIDDPTTPRILRRVYQLEAIADGCSPTFERVQGASAIETLMPNVYRLTLAEHMGQKAAVFAICAQIAKKVSVYKFQRPKQFDALAGSIARLEDHLLRDLT